MNIVYLHLGWAMNYPFSPRTWSMAEWSCYLGHLKVQAVDTLMLWPGFEFIDIASLEEWQIMQKWIQDLLNTCHQQKLKVWLGRSINAYCLHPNKPFHQRDVRDCRYLSPLDPEYSKTILSPLRFIFNNSVPFEGWWCIDRDPGNSFDTSSQVFAEAIHSQIECLPSIHRVLHWMWGGWTQAMGQQQDWRQQKQDFWTDAAMACEQLFEHEATDLHHLCCWPGHLKSLSINSPHHIFPYHRCEPEPSIPWSYEACESNHHEEQMLTPQPEQMIYNLQTPCLRTHHLLQLFKKDTSPRDQTSLPLELKSTKWNNIEELWCWNDESLETCKTSWMELKAHLHAPSLEQRKKSIEKWKRYVGCDFPTRRGFLHELLHHA